MFEPMFTRSRPYHDTLIQICDWFGVDADPDDAWPHEGHNLEMVSRIFKLTERALVENRTLVVTVDQQREMLSE